jgi:hypothetical protein
LKSDHMNLGFAVEKDRMNFGTAIKISRHSYTVSTQGNIDI